MLTHQKIFPPLLPKLFCGFFLGLLALQVSAQAATSESGAQLAPALVTTQSYTVTKSADTNDGACNGDCSLREAVIAANANPGLDTITLPSGLYNLTLTGAGEDATKGDLDIRDDLVIEGVDGASTIIDGGAKDRLLHIARPASGATTAPTVTLRRVTLRNGKATNGAAIYSQGNLTLEAVTLANNQATQNGGAVACIDETADFTLRDSVISGNSAPSNQLFEGAGGGIYLSRCGFLSVDRTTFQANSAQNGGAIYLNEAGYAISQSSVINNGARNNGGGIFAGATAGGAIGFSTLSGNQANGSGGGLYIGGDGSATLYNLTIVNNRADQDQTGDGDGGGLASRGFFRISQTILAGNSDGGGSLSPDCATNFAADSESFGYNLIQNSAGCTLGGTLTGNITGVDPQLGALQANGGPTLTHLPALSSPVVDAIPLADCGTSVDQRGVARPQASNSAGNPACEIGAVEVPAVPTAPCDFIASNEAALRNAITCVNAGREGVYTITVTADIAYTQVSLAINNRLADRVVIQGNGHTLNAAQQGRGLTADTLRHLMIQDLTLTGGQGGAPAVPIVPEEGGGLLVYCGVGGNCTTQLDNVTLHHNQAASGGGLSIYCYVDTDCATTVQNSLIHHNQATTSGGGIDTGIDEENYTFALTVRDTVVHDNRAEFGGGIRAHAGDFELINSTLHHNEAVEGGGFYTRSGYILRARISNSTIHSNLATQGGGIYAFSRDSGGVAMTLVNSTVSSNAVLTGTGGGLYLGSEFSSGHVALINSTVAQNGAATGAGLFFFNQSSDSAVDHAVVISNTLIAANNGADCASDGFAPLSQPLHSGGNNLDSDGSCLTPGIAQASDLVSAAANLGPLVNNGGSTQTHALLAGSAALDAGNDATCAATPVNGLDQRGVARPQGTRCDSGAVEVVVGAACDLVASDEASLRRAIECVNSASAGAYTVTVTADIRYTQPIAPISNLAISNLLIAGNGHTLDAGGHGRVLALDNVQNATLRDLTLTGGLVDVNDLAPNGGGLSLNCSSDLINAENVCTWTLRNTTVRNNRASSGGGISYRCDYHGGGALIVQDSIIRNNQAENAGGGIFYSSDEESGRCSLTLRNTRVEENQAVDGGGLRILRPRVTLIDSTIRNNVASESGGGLMARISDGFITMTVQSSTISGNQAGVSGGGLYIASPDQTFDIKLINSTVSGNSVTNGAGGGLYLGESSGSLQIALINSTVTQNASGQGAGVHIFHQASTSALTGTLRLNNTIIADNLGSNCADAAAVGVVFSGPRVTSYGHNLDSDGNCLPPSVAQPSDIVNGTANLGVLADNGGATQTHALLPGSAAIDAGNDAACAAVPVNGVDQRGVARPQGAHCDIGAVEMQSPDDGVTFTVTKFTDSNDGVCDADCSLREAISAANLRAGRATIQLAGGTYLLSIPTLRDGENDTVDEDANALGDLDIAHDLLLLGSPTTATIIDGNQVDRVFEVLSTANVTLADLTIRNGLVSAVGAGLSNSGNLTLQRVQVVGNRAASAFSTGNGGGLFNDGVLTVANSLIADNHAGGGEASYGEGGGIRNQGVLTVTQSTLRGNTVSDDNDYGIGGGISTQGIAYIERSLLSNNATSGGPGGAIANRLGGQLRVVNSTLSGNRAGSGAGIANGDAFDAPGTVLLIHVTIANNQGGGLYNRGVTSATNTIIAGNALGENDPTLSQNCFNEGTFTSLGATLLGNVGNCPSNGPGDSTIDNTTVLTTLLGALADNGAPGGYPTQTHALLPGSLAIDTANDSACPATDQRGVVRPQGAHCDIGAYEATVGTATRPLFVSSTSSGKAGAVYFRDEDILHYDPASGAWALLFDGSDVGISDDVDAFALQADGSLLLSLSNPVTLTGLGLVDDSDIVQFVAATLGVTTTGTFAWYLDGSDVGLTADEEDIDAIDFAPDGRLLVSTSNNGFGAPGVTDGHDEDVFVLTEAVFGEQSSGVWELYLDGSAVAISTGRDINGLWVDPANGDLYLSTNGSYTVPGLSGDKDDIFVCTPTGLGAASACTFRLFWDGDTAGFGNERLDGVDLGAAPATFNPATSAITAADTTADEPQEEAAENDEERLTPLYLPVIRNAAR